MNPLRNDIKIKNAVKILLPFLFLAFLVGCKVTLQNNKLQVNYDESSFNDFYIEDETVYYKCTVCVKNTYSTAKTFHISADFKDDFNNGLISEENLIGYNSDESSDFVLEANQSNSFEVVFVGKYAHQTEQKSDRLLPDIICEVV